MLHSYLISTAAPKGYTILDDTRRQLAIVDMGLDTNNSCSVCVLRAMLVCCIHRGVLETDSEVATHAFYT